MPATPSHGDLVGDAALRRLEDVLRRALDEALADLDPARLVARELPKRPPKRARVRVVAIGKAAPRMTAGALEAWGDRITDALVVTTEGTPAGVSSDARTTLLFAAHPVPDERSVEAAREAMRRARELSGSDLFLALVSGGASALAALPAEGVSIEEKARYVAELLDRGAPITTVNLVRRHVSRIKGGRLAAEAGRARVLTLVLSDVIGGEPHDVGSGPTVADPTTPDDARAALATEGLSFPPDRFWVPPAPPLARARVRVLAGPEDLARAVAERLATAGLVASTAPAESGDAEDVVRRRLAQASALGPGRALVIPCEPTLRLPPRRGRGGRAGWIAATLLRSLPDDVVLLCAASDGIDGSSGRAGAVVSARHRASVSEADLDTALTAFDDASLHERLGTHLGSGPTGTNLTDVHVLARP